MKEETASLRVNLRMAPTVKAKLLKAAKLRKFTLTDFIVRSSQEAAEAVLAEQVRFVLPAKQWQAFNAALDAPASSLQLMLMLKDVAKAMSADNSRNPG